MKHDGPEPQEPSAAVVWLVVAVVPVLAALVLFLVLVLTG